MLLEADMPCKCVVFEQPGFLCRLWNVLWYVMIKSAKSIQESMLYSSKLGKILRAFVAETGPDLIICDTFRTGQFFEKIRRPKGVYILYMDDLFSLRYARMLDILSRFRNAELNVLGNFSRFVPASLRPLIRSRLVQKLLLRSERRLVEKRERTCVQWFDKSLLINGDEAELLRKETGLPSIQTIKPLLSNPTTDTNRGYHRNLEFVFLGDLSIPHNQFSISHFIENYMGRTIEKIPGIELRIIGRGADDELLRLVEQYKGSVTVEGFVEDLEAVFYNSCAMIIPLLFGSGVKIKTLEALSRGVPILSTSYGVEGISVTSGVNCLVEDDVSRYPRLMSNFTDVGYNQSISRGARNLYRDVYSKKRILYEYDALFGYEEGPDVHDARRNPG